MLTTSRPRNCVSGRGAARGGVDPLTGGPCAGIFATVKTPTGTHAVVRGVPSTFDQAIAPGTPAQPIDVRLAREQHLRYCSTLRGAGLALIKIESDDRFPDCVFIEDTAVVVVGKAIIAEMAAETRRGETDAVEQRLGEFLDIHYIEPPATLDGGDVLRIDTRIFVGLSKRTNRQAADQLAAILEPDGFDIVRVPVHHVLHLKSACTHVGEDVILLRPGYLDEAAFDSYRTIIVPESEPHAANCLSINGRVLIPTGAPRTRDMLSEYGCTTVELEISESRKAAGLLTCSSIILGE
jgi:dimethylargininase